MGAVRLGKVAIAVAMAMFSVAALYVSALIGQRQETLNRVSRYNVAWSASQAVAELGRLEHRVAAYGLADGGVARDEVELRFDVLLNRLQLLDSGEVKSFADSDPELASIVDELDAAVHDVQRDIEGIDKAGAVRRILDRLAPLDTKLVRFAAAANRYGGDHVADDQRQLLRLHRLFSIIAVGLIFCGVVLAGLLFLQNRLLRRAHDEVRALALNLRRTSVSKEYLDNIVDGMSEGLLVVTPEGGIEKVNQAACRLTGFSPRELIGAALSTLVPGEAPAEITPEWLRAVDELRERSGGRLPVRLSCATMPGNEADGARLVCVFQSLADQRRAETERTELREQLYQAQKMQAIGTLAGGIAHDFNNILGSILGHGFLAIEDIGPDHPAQTSLEQIMRSGERAKLLVQQILTYSRNAEFRLESVEAGKAVAESLALVRSGIPGHIRVEADTAATVPIEVDSTQLHQVLLNLCVNAAQAIGSAPGAIHVVVEEIEIGSADVTTDDGHDGVARMWFGTPAPGRYCRISVGDTGCGMDRATMARIFEPFFTTKEVGSGTGLGLAAVHGILRNHKAVAAVESEPGGGTKFEVHFPASTSQPVEVVEAAPAVVAPPGTHERILLVDDDQSLLEVTRASLVKLGYHVVAFSQPEKALESFKLMPDAWDLVLTDRTMPKITGEELARQILAVRRDIPVVVMTGYGDPSDEQRTREIGISDFLFKPVVGPDLAAAVRRALEGTRPAKAA